MIKQFDADGDGQIDFDEFKMTLMQFFTDLARIENSQI